MLCPNCSAEVPDDAQFCHNCGVAITQPGEVQSLRARISRRLVLTAAGAVAVAIIAGAVSVFAIVQPFGGDGEPPGQLGGEAVPSPTAEPREAPETVEPSPSPSPTVAPQSDARIVYEQGGDVFVIRSDGSDNRKLFSVQKPLPWGLSPDGTKLAYVEPSDPFTPTAVYVVSVQGGEAEPVFEAPEATKLRDLRWSPAGGFITIFSRSSGGLEFLYWISIPPEGGPGETVAEWTAGDRGAGTLRLGQRTILDVRRDGLSFAPDDRLIFTVCGSSAQTGCKTYFGDIDFGGQTTDESLLPPCSSDDVCLFSPDGKWLLYSEYDFRTQTLGPFAVISVEGGLSSIGRGVEAYAWSPDSTRIAVVSETGTLFVTDVAGGESLPLTRPSATPLSSALVWSQDSQRVYFRDPNKNLFVANADGSGGREVLPDEVRFCVTPRGLVVALEREDHPGIDALEMEDPFLFRAAGEMSRAEEMSCRVSADFEFALQTFGGSYGFYLIDLTASESGRLVKEGAVSFAAWAGSCATNGCPAVIPAPAPTPAPELTPTLYACSEYQVQEGDTFPSIAQSFGVTFEDLLVLNGLTEEGSLFIQPGEILYIPC